MRASVIAPALVLLAATAAPRAAGAADPHFADLRSPAVSGHRQVSALVDFKGVPENRMTVFVVYSDSRDEVVKAFGARTRTAREPSGNASCSATGDGKYRCSFFFPHAAHTRPNAKDYNAKLYRPGITVHYAWAKAFTPSGATSQLTLNSEVQAFVMPRPMTIALLGDSYSSGEGAPNRPLRRTAETLNGALDNGAGMWDDALCHRSRHGGLLQGVKALIARSPGFEVDYVNVTCSGATIGDGVIENQFIEPGSFPMDPGKRKPGGSKPGQLRQVLDWLGAKQYPVLDALVMSIGGNDVGFDWVVTTCLAAIFSDCADEVKQVARQGLADLPAAYAALNGQLVSQFQARRKAIGRVFITEYPDPTTGADGRSCSLGLTRGTGNPFDCWGPLEAGISASDFSFLKVEVLTGLNRAVAAAARANGLDFVGGIAEKSVTHGLCNCSGGYFNTLGQSDHLQGDLFGSIHPNAAGFSNAYAPQVSKELRQYLLQRLTAQANEEKQISQFAAQRAQPVRLPPSAIKGFSQKLKPREKR
jgi:lysophospholipase L1-like esterase